MNEPDLRPTREVTYRARSKDGMTPAEVAIAMEKATVICRCGTTLRGKIITLVVLEP